MTGSKGLGRDVESPEGVTSSLELCRAEAMPETLSLHYSISEALRHLSHALLGALLRDCLCLFLRPHLSLECSEQLLEATSGCARMSAVAASHYAAGGHEAALSQAVQVCDNARRKGCLRGRAAQREELLVTPGTTLKKYHGAVYVCIKL